MDNYFYINQNENTKKEWTNNYLGKIVKTTYRPETNKIYQYSIEYNTPQNYIQYLNNNTKKDFNADRQNVMKNIYQETKYK